MDDVTVLITGAGAPGIKGTLYSLKNNFDCRGIRTIGVDIRADVVGKYLCDSFYQIPKPSDESFISSLLDICNKEKVDVILPQVTDELPQLSSHRIDFERIGTNVAISNKEAIEISNNKYELLKISKEIRLPTPEFYLVANFDDLERRIEELGWPKKPVVVKPPISSGMRGLRIVVESFDRRTSFYTEKPSAVFLNREELRSILGHLFPKLLVMKFLPGKEYSVDLLTANETTVIPRSRDVIRTGITFGGTVEKNEEIIKYSRSLGKRLGLEYAYGFQFKLDENNVPKVIECNPRIQGTMVLSTLAGANIMYGAVKHALVEKLPKFKIKWGTRLLRYWGGVGIQGGKILREIL